MLQSYIYFRIIFFHVTITSGFFFGMLNVFMQDSPLSFIYSEAKKRGKKRVSFVWDYSLHFLLYAAMKGRTAKVYIFSLLNGFALFYYTSGFIQLESSIGSLSGNLGPRNVIFTCNAMNFSSGSIDWFIDNTAIAKYRFNTGDMFPRIVSINPPIPGVTVRLGNMISRDSLISFQNFTLMTDLCSLLQFEGQSLSCGFKQQRSEVIPIDISPLELGDMLRVNYTATYSEDGRLMEIDVEWEDVMDDFGCDINTVYVVELRTNGKSENITLNTENCTNKVCLVIFQDLMENTNGSYEVRVVANNQFNETEVYTSSITIMSNIMDIIETNGCNLSIRCPTSFNGKCIVLNDLEDSSSSEVDQLSRTFNITLSISRQKIPLEVITFNDSLRVILKYNYTTDIKDNGAVIGAGVAAFIFGFILLALGCIVAFTARFSKSCPCQIMTKDDYRCCWITTLVYSVAIILLFIALLILWIIVSTTARSDSCPTVQPYLEIIAMSLSFVLVVLSTIMLATFILLILLKSKNKREESYEIEEKVKLIEYKFEYGTEEVLGNKDDKTCANCGVVTGISLKDHFCETCGKRLCRECRSGKVFIYHKLDYGFACRDCKAKYWEENKQFSHNDPVRVISSNMGDKHTDVCAVCKQDFQVIKICCKSCGNDVCDREKCHCKKIPLKVAKEEKKVNKEGEEVVTEEETVVCSICYMLYQRKKHKNNMTKHDNIEI